LRLFKFKLYSKNNAAVNQLKKACSICLRGNRGNSSFYANDNFT